MSVGGYCDTFGCSLPATRRAFWKDNHGDYCEACAAKLYRNGDRVEPPFDPDAVLPLHPDDTDGF